MAESCCRPSTPASSSCCGQPPRRTEKWITGSVETDVGAVPRISTVWGSDEARGQVRCRVAYKARMTYTVEPGLYAVGEPTPESPVFVSANYKLSFDILRRELAGLDGWVLVLDTKGINVWCAAGKGTFGTRELCERIMAARLDKVVTHRKIVVPQLGAPGIKAHLVQKSTGFRVHYGPVPARDIKEYLGAGLKARDAMRRVPFGMVDRLVLTPMELNVAFRDGWKYAVGLAILFGMGPRGILFADIVAGLPFLAAALAAVVAGAFLTPALLPWVPSRAFSIKGLVMGILVTGAMTWLFRGALAQAPFELAAAWALFPALSSYLAYNFTGCTTFTNPSGVKRELTIALWYYLAAAGVAAICLILHKLTEWGLLWR